MIQVCKKCLHVELTGYYFLYQVYQVSSEKGGMTIIWYGNCSYFVKTKFAGRKAIIVPVLLALWMEEKNEKDSDDHFIVHSGHDRLIWIFSGIQ